MLEINNLVEQVRGLQSKMLLLVGKATAARDVLDAYARIHDSTVVGIGAALSRQLIAVQRSYRPIEAARVFREIVDSNAKNGVCLLTNLEVLFDTTLELDPLLLMRQSARTTTMVAVWPGIFQNGRLTYAMVGHPERRDYDSTGIQLASVA